MKLLQRCSAILLGLFVVFGAAAPVVRAGDLILGGQKHEYKVILRGDGRAIVVGKMTIPNTGAGPLTNIRVGLSVTDATQMSAYQVVVEQSCSKLDTSSGTSVCTKYKDVSSKDITNAPYEKMAIVDDTDSGDGYLLSLPQSVDPGASAVVLLAYSSKEYTDESFGLFSYTFATPTVDERIESMSVIVQTDSDLYIDGEGTEIKYTEDFPDDTFADATGLSAESALTTISSKRGNTVRESASDLFPGESYTVTGRYSEFWWRLSIGRILFGVLIVALVIGFGIWRLRKASMANPIPMKQRIHAILSGTPLVSGFFAALLIGVWTYVAINVVSAQFVRHARSPLVIALIGIVVAMMYLLVGLGPSVLFGAKRGWKAGVMTFVATIVWLIIGIAVFAAFGGDSVLRIDDFEM
ncbi:MAG: hypothetical protein AAB473_00545 [Patescibacteria group bacterium]